MNYKHLSKLTLAILTATGIVACGGGGGSGGGTAANTKLFSGTVTGFGSYYMSGNHIQTDHLDSVTIDGLVADPSDVQIGDHLEICVEVQNDGTYQAISALSNDELEGVVTTPAVPDAPWVTGDSRNALTEADCGASLEVMSKVVNFDSNLMFYSDDPAVINICQVDDGMSLEVHGNPLNGEINATKIEVKSVSEDTEVKGTLTLINDMTFDVDGVLVDYSGLSVDVAALDGLFVEVKLDTTTIPATGAAWTALDIEAEDEEIAECAISEGDDSEVEGDISRGLGDPGVLEDLTVVPVVPGVAALGANQFEINGDTIIEVDLNLTTYEDGDINALIVGAEVEVDGTYNAEGVLIANNIELEVDDSNAIEIEGTFVGVTNADDTAFDPLTFNETVVYYVTISDGTVDHVVALIQVDAVMHDETGDTSAQGSFDVRDLIAGDVLKLKVLDDGSSLNVIKLERRELAPVV